VLWELCGVPVSDWWTKEERAMVERAARRATVLDVAALREQFVDDVHRVPRAA
jgi:hypothetical protein